VVMSKVVGRGTDRHDALQIEAGVVIQYVAERCGKGAVHVVTCDQPRLATVFQSIIESDLRCSGALRDEDPASRLATNQAFGLQLVKRFEYCHPGDSEFLA